MPPPKGSAAGAPAGGGRRLKYETVRDSFLAETPLTAEEELHYFTRIGMYVFRRWQAIADDHEHGQAIDEAACEPRWDECTDRGFSKIRDDAQTLIDKEMRRGRITALLAGWAEAWAPIKWLTNSMSWIAWKALEHIVGTIGLIAFALMLVLVAPRVVKEGLEVVEVILRDRTEPAEAPRSLPPKKGAAEAAPGVASRATD